METLTLLAGRATLDLQSNGSGLLASDSIFFESGACVDSVFSGRTWSLRLQATSREVYEQKIVPILLSKGREVMVRWGIDAGARILWRPLESFRVLVAKAEWQTASGTGRGCPFELTLGNSFSSMGLVQRVVARTGKISDIATRIAVDYNLEPQVEPTGGAPVTLVQTFESDLQFLQSRLVGAAVNTNGLAGYYCYVEEGNFHFHTRDWKQSPVLLPYNLLSAGATNLITRDQAQESARNGGQDLRLIAYDPINARTEVVTADPQRYLRFGPRLSAAEGTVISGAHVGPNQIGWERSRLLARYASNRDQFERMVFSIPNAWSLRAGMILALQMPDPGAAVNGFYHVEKIELSIQGGAATSIVTAARGEMAGRQTLANVRSAEAADQPLPSPASAPGVDPNFQVSSGSSFDGNSSVKVRPGS